MKISVIRLIIFLFSCFLFQNIVSAQQAAASLTGVITDQNGAVVQGVSVTATSKSTNLRRTVSTDDEGVFVISNLPVGDYEIKVSARGFKILTLDSVRLSVGQTQTV
ncbi:MAG TPA: carboxypeptidase-like regulatory domain-containing protein, partial [Pyrinomonadaceae bacterium]